MGIYMDSDYDEFEWEDPDELEQLIGRLVMLKWADIRDVRGTLGDVFVTIVGDVNPKWVIVAVVLDGVRYDFPEGADLWVAEPFIQGKIEDDYRG